MIREMSGYEVKALHYELLLKDILTAAEKLPPFPGVVWKVMSLLRKMAPVKEIEEVIKYDQVIAARVLRISQSTYYCRMQKVTSLKEAIMVLGNQKLVQVVLSACTSRYFQGKASGYDLDERQLWQHSVATAFMGECIAKHLKSKRGLTVYTACLLHDIGKTVLDLYARMYLHINLNQIRKTGVQFIEAERRALGIDHQELGKIIARRWQFPKEVASGIEFHHTPQRAESDQEIVHMVYAANQIVNTMRDEVREQETGEESPSFDFEQDPIFKQMGLSHDVAQQLKAQLTESMDGIEVYLQKDA